MMMAETSYILFYELYKVRRWHQACMESAFSSDQGLWCMLTETCVSKLVQQCPVWWTFSMQEVIEYFFHLSVRLSISLGMDLLNEISSSVFFCCFYFFLWKYKFPWKRTWHLFSYLKNSARRSIIIVSLGNVKYKGAFIPLQSYFVR